MADAAAPVQISTEWWMAMAPTGLPYFHNTKTGETTWIAPMLSLESQSAAVSNNCDEANKEASAQTPQTLAAQDAGLSSGMGQSSAAAEDGRRMMMGAAPPQVKHDITATGKGNIPKPWYTFADCDFDRSLLQEMVKAGFATPTAIQAYAWPVGCAGRDMIGVAKTGSGKTLGFLLPAFASILKQRLSGGPLMLVMAPTRELAVQIDQDAKKFLSPSGVKTALAYGGAPKRDQLQELRNRPELLTATPGRLNDFIEMGSVRLDQIAYVCLDEADRMLDMGFEPQIRKILEKCPRRRQTFMFTATWPREVRDLANDFMYDPVEIRVGDADALKANDDIDQQVQICNQPRDKEDACIRLVRDCREQVLIFTATKRMCEQLCNTLRRTGTRVESIHGDRDQSSRDRALGALKSGDVKVLVATDVAARGLDVKTIRLVINFDPANNAEDYVHRIGRTARAGMTGTAVSLLMSSEGKKAAQIVEVMKKSGKPVPPELERMCIYEQGGRQRFGKAKGKGGGGGGGDRGRGRSRSRGRDRSRSRGGDRYGGGGGGGDYGGSRGGGGDYGGNPGYGAAAYGGGAYGMPMGGMPMGGMPMYGGMPMGGGYGGGMPMGGGYGGGGYGGR